MDTRKVVEIYVAFLIAVVLLWLFMFISQAQVEVDWEYSYLGYKLNPGEYTILTNSSLGSFIERIGDDYIITDNPIGVEVPIVLEGVDVFSDGSKVITTKEDYELLADKSRIPEKVVVSFFNYAYASIARHAGYGHASAAATSITQAYDIGSDSNKILVVAVYQDGTKCTPTYAGNAMTDLNWTPANTGFGEIFWRDVVDNGSNNIVCSNTGGGLVEINYVSYDGADTVQSFNESTSAGSGSASLTVTTTVNNSYVLTTDWNFDAGGPGGISATSGTELMANKSVTGGIWQGLSDIQKVTAGSQVMTWTNTDANYDMAGIEITEFSGGSGFATASYATGSYYDLDITQSTFFHSFVLFMMSFFFPVWYFNKKRNDKIIRI